MLVNSPRLPNIPAIADTSRGKRSAHVDLDTEAGRLAMNALIRDAHVLVQGYRPNSLARRGFGPLDVARLRPGNRLCLAERVRHPRPVGGAARLRLAGADRDGLQRRGGEGRGPGGAAAPADADPGSGHRLPDRARRLRRPVPAAARRRQLARAGLAGADRPVAAQSGPGRGRLPGAARGARALPGNAGVGLRRAALGAPQRPARTHAGGVEPTPRCRPAVRCRSGDSPLGSKVAQTGGFPGHLARETGTESG